MMKTDNHLNSLQANLDGSASIAAPPRKADEHGRHFLVPWHFNADTAQPSWQQGDDAGCGQVPVD